MRRRRRREADGTRVKSYGDEQYNDKKQAAKEDEAEGEDEQTAEEEKEGTEEGAGE